MKKLNIFKAGKHTSAAGDKIEFTEQDLSSTVAAYDPAVHEAPIVVGHPKDNNPAYGWVSGLSFSEETGLEADTTQVDPDFSDMVNAGRFKKISASFYTPDSPNNPSPGIFYLRHVGFLGAQAPAVKGLRDASFNQQEEGVVEFGDWSDVQNASLWRKMREWIIGKDGIEEADKVLPSYAIEDMEVSAREPVVETKEKPLDNFTEGNNMNTQEQKALQDENDKLKLQIEANKQQSSDFTEREAALALKEANATRAENDAFISDLVSKGKVLPAQKAGLSQFMQTLDESVVIEFNEGDVAATKPQTAFFKEFLESQPKMVDFDEHSNDDGHEGGEKLAPELVAEKAQDYMEEQRLKGREITISQAVAHILK